MVFLLLLKLQRAALHVSGDRAQERMRILPSILPTKTAPSVPPIRQKCNKYLPLSFLHESNASPIDRKGHKFYSVSPLPAPRHIGMSKPWSGLGGSEIHRSLISNKRDSINGYPLSSSSLNNRRNVAASSTMREFNADALVMLSSLLELFPALQPFFPSNQSHGACAIVENDHSGMV
jgi:hypothetical protein